MSRAPKHVIKEIKTALRYARMDDGAASFGDQKIVYRPRWGDGASVMTVDAMVKHETELWRKSWLIPPLERLLAWAEGKP